MKLRIYRQPMLFVNLIALATVVFALAVFLCGGAFRLLLAVIAGVYACAFLLGLFCLNRIRINEGGISFEKAERILIVAPHQDDCVLCAGGFGAKNLRLGGETHIVYLTQPSDENLRRIRCDEAVASWQLAGCPAENLLHFDLLPRSGVVDPNKIREAARELQRVIDEIKPTMLFVPLYEGGHVQHDIVNYIISFLVSKPEGMRIYECPEYSPYVSLARTPHKVLGLLTRVFGGFVSYYGVPESVDGRTVLNLRMDEQELELKRDMLRKFQSQNGEALAVNHGCPDRVIEWQERDYQPQPFNYEKSFCRFIAALRNSSMGWIAKKLFPGDDASFGLERGITNLDAQLSEPEGES